ncbi:hypothetical protein SMICM304S_00163 [Streptomyces microflavus]
MERQIALVRSPELRALYEEVAGYPVADRGAGDRAGEGTPSFALPLVIEHGGQVLSFIASIATFNTPMDVTVAELAIETFLPADRETAAYLRDRLPSRPPGPARRSGRGGGTGPVRGQTRAPLSSGSRRGARARRDAFPGTGGGAPVVRSRTRAPGTAVNTEDQVPHDDADEQGERRSRPGESLPSTARATRMNRAPDPGVHGAGDGLEDRPARDGGQGCLPVSSAHSSPYPVEDHQPSR